MDSWIRYFHVILNLLFILAGFVIMGFGLYVLLGSPSHELLTTYFTKNLVMIYGTIGIGGVVLLVGTCGAAGSCYQHKCMLMTYLSINVIFILAQLAVIIYVVVEKGSMENNLAVIWKGLNNETKEVLQHGFSCCGYKSPGEWEGDLPSSCLNNTIPEGEDPTPWSNTCYDSIVGYFGENIILAGVIAGVLFLLEAFQIVVTRFLVRDINEKRRRRNSTTMRNNNAEVDSDGYMKNQAYEESS